MLEAMLTAKSSGQLYFPDSGPGSKFLKAGNEQIGWFGEVSGALMFQGVEVSDFLGLTAGTVNKEVNNNWLKFIYKGKYLFVCKDGVRANLTWTDIYKAGGIYGMKGNGPYPVSGFPTDQWKIIIKPEPGASTPWKFAVRVLSGTSVDPYVGTDYIAFGLAEGNEFNDLIYRLLTVGTNSRPNTGLFEKWTTADLGTGYNILKETSAANTANIMLRGITGATIQFSKAGSAADALWRPVLEVVKAEDTAFSPYALYQEVIATQGPSPLKAVISDAARRPSNVITESTPGPFIQTSTFVDPARRVRSPITVSALTPVSMTFART